MADKQRMIDANDLRTQFDDIPPFIGLSGGLVQQYIDKAPTVDAVEVKHGQWINKSTIKPPFFDYRFDCSVCGCTFYHAGIDSFAYCPFCGAKMDGGTVNG